MTPGSSPGMTNTTATTTIATMANNTIIIMTLVSVEEGAYDAATDTTADTETSTTVVAVRETITRDDLLTGLVLPTDVKLMIKQGQRTNMISLINSSIP